VVGLEVGLEPIAGFLVAGRHHPARVTVVELAVFNGGELTVAGSRDAPCADRGWQDAVAPLRSFEFEFFTSTRPKLSKHMF
jgi:hypothetical protein